jgi:hypothetical protein
MHPHQGGFVHDGMTWGMGLFGWLFWIVVILAIAALVKYLFGKP